MLAVVVEVVMLTMINGEKKETLPLAVETKGGGGGGGGRGGEWTGPSRSLDIF